MGGCSLALWAGLAEVKMSPPGTTSPPAQLMSPLASSPSTVFMVPFFTVMSGLVECMVWVTNLATLIFSTWVWFMKARSMFFMFEPPPVRMMPPSSLS